MRITVCPLEELADGEVRVFENDGVEGIVIRGGDNLYACERYCTHERFPLEFGEVEDEHLLVCTYHGARFDLRSGKVITPPATVELKVYDVAEEDGNIVVNVTEHGE